MANVAILVGVLMVVGLVWYNVYLQSGGLKKPPPPKPPPSMANLRGGLAKQAAAKTWNCSECKTVNSGLSESCTNCGTPLHKNISDYLGRIIISVIVLSGAIFLIWVSLTYEGQPEQEPTKLHFGDDFKK